LIKKSQNMPVWFSKIGQFLRWLVNGHRNGCAPVEKSVIYLWSKVICLFCFVCTDEIYRTGMLQIVFLVSLESSREGGVHWLGFLVFVLGMQNFLNIEWFLHSKLN
jgi:hypothetical protein